MTRPNHDLSYEQKDRTYFDNTRTEMLRFIPNDVESIIEIGCGTGSFGARLKGLRDIHYTGIDFDPESVRIASTRIDEALCLNVEKEELPFQRRFDCIICNDVLEHMYDPWSVLKKLALTLTPRGYIVVSIPNIRYFPVFKEYFLQSQWVYRENGVMDWTHIRFFTEKSVRHLVESSGFEILACEGINGERFPWKFALLNRMLLNRLDDMRWQQFACVGRLNT